MLDSTPTPDYSGRPALRLFGAEPAEGGTTLIEIARPGRYALTIWTEAEWKRLHPGDRPSAAYRHGSTWFAIAASK